MSHIIKNKEDLTQETKDHSGQANKERPGEQKKGKYKKEIESSGFVLAQGSLVMWLTRVKSSFSFLQ